MEKTSAAGNAGLQQQFAFRKVSIPKEKFRVAATLVSECLHI